MRVVLVRLAVALATLALGSCAGLPGGAAAQVTLHEQDAGRTISVQVGDTITVDLVDRFFVPGSSIVWDADSSDARVLQRAGTSRENPPAIMNAQARYSAVFKAVGPGRAEIQMVGTTRCEAMNPEYCPGHSGTITVQVR
jgi:hypothetical protein